MNATAETQMQPQVKPRKIGEIVDAMSAIRETMRHLNQQVKDLQQEYDALDAELQSRMTEQGIDQARGTKATASLSSTVVPTVKDWDAFYEYIQANDALYLLQRRPAAGPCRELFDAGETIPGVDRFTKTAINLRNN